MHSSRKLRSSGLPYTPERVCNLLVKGPCDVIGHWVGLWGHLQKLFSAIPSCICSLCFFILFWFQAEYKMRGQWTWLWLNCALKVTSNYCHINTCHSWCQSVVALAWKVRRKTNSRCTIFEDKQARWSDTTGSHMELLLVSTSRSVYGTLSAGVGVKYRRRFFSKTHQSRPLVGPNSGPSVLEYRDTLTRGKLLFDNYTLIMWWSLWARLAKYLPHLHLYNYLGYYQRDCINSRHHQNKGLV